MLQKSQDFNLKEGDWKLTSVFYVSSLFILEKFSRSLVGTSFLSPIVSGAKAVGGLHLLGLGACFYPIYHIFNNTPKRKFKRILEKSLTTNIREKVKIKKLDYQEYGYSALIQLPSGITVTEFGKHLEAIEQDTYTKVRLTHIGGNRCSLEFSTSNIPSFVTYEEAPKGNLAIPLATAFGWKYLDFQDESSCHMVGGGATRMGKTCWQLLLATHLYTQSEGEINLFISSAKLSDYYMFRNLPNVTLVEPEETLEHLYYVIGEYTRRKQIINKLGNVNDAKTLKREHPEKSFTPFFVIVDEVAVFAEDKEVQQALTEIAERAGYVDIHLIVFSQRPDAREVLKPRIKANMLTKMAFTTASENDSKIILGVEGAEKLGGKKGRAILIDGLPEEVQVPYISNQTAEKLLAPYKEYKMYEQRRIEYDEPRQEDTNVTETLPSFITTSLRETDMS